MKSIDLWGILLYKKAFKIDILNVGRFKDENYILKMMTEETITVWSDVYKMNIECFDDFIYRHSIKIDRVWDKEVIDEMVSYYEEGTDVIDVGANVGLVALGTILKSDKEIARIHCFECDQQTLGVLFKNTLKFPQIKIYPFALSDRQELCQINSSSYNMGCSHIIRSENDENEITYDYTGIFDAHSYRTQHSFFVLGVPLDSIKYHFKNRVSVIKIDVEGFEVKVLKGMEGVIRTHRPVVIVEVFDKNKDAVCDFFKKLDYHDRKILINHVYTTTDIVFVPKPL